MPSRISPSDLTLINCAFDCAQTALAAWGKVNGFCVFEDDQNERLFLPSGEFYDSSDKDDFVDLCRIAGAASRARALVVVSESWKLDGIDDAERPHLEELWRKGKLGQHPRARECVSLILECDIGIVSVSREIVRSVPLWPTLAEVEDRDIDVFPYGDTSFEGRFQRMLLPREKRSEAAEMASEMLSAMGIKFISAEEFNAVAVKPQA